MSKATNVGRTPPAGQRARFELFDRIVTGLILDETAGPAIESSNMLRVEYQGTIYRVERSDVLEIF